MIIFILADHLTFVLFSHIELVTHDSMALNKRIYEIIYLLLIINFFYEGAYKIVNLNSYGYWLRHVPILKNAEDLLVYLVPVADISATIMLLVPRTRNAALYGIIAGELIMILWIMSILLFTGWLIFPFQTLWDKPNWMEKILYGLALSWLALLAILIDDGKDKKYSSKTSLRKRPVNVN